MKKTGNIDDYKGDFKKMKIPDIKTIQKIQYGEDISNFINIIRHQDKEDEQFLLRKKILPVLLGIIILVVVFMIVPIKNPVILSGSLMVFLGLLAILILFIRDYRNISKETFGLNLKEYLQNKMVRLKSWRSTPKLHNIIFVFFAFGCCIMLLGNARFMASLNNTQNILLFITAYVLAFIVSWIIGEYRYRRRHKNHHMHLIKNISELLKELGGEGNNDKSILS